MMGTMDARNMWSNLAENKYLHTVASHWISSNYFSLVVCLLPTFLSASYSEITAAFHISFVSVSLYLFILPDVKKNKTFK